MQDEEKSTCATTGGSLPEFAPEKKEGAARVCANCLLSSTADCTEPGCPGEARFVAWSEALMTPNLRQIRTLIDRITLLETLVLTSYDYLASGDVTNVFLARQMLAEEAGKIRTEKRRAGHE